MRKKRERSTDKPRTLVGWFLVHAKDMIAVLILVGMASAGMNHFATASDVKQTFNSLRVEVKIVALEGRKTRIEDELFRLRSDPKKQGSQAQIQRFEAELRDVTQRLRDLEREQK